MKSNLNKLSIVLATHNEESNISKCLTAIKDLADEIIIVDGESTDNTVEIAKTFKAKVISTTNKPMFHTNKQMAIDSATNNWILLLDADEVVDDELISFILFKLDLRYSAYWLKRKNYFLNHFLTKGGQYPNPVIRLFQKDKARLPQQSVHEQMIVDGTIGIANGHLLHYNAPNFSRYITNANRYTDFTANQMYINHTKLSLANDLNYLLVQPLNTFCNSYFRHKGIVDGFPGFVFAFFSGLHYALAYMKLGDLYRENTH